MATYDFVSDDKPAKRIAVDMIRMVNAINDTHLANSEVSRTIDVTCVTCHRGVSRPYPIEFILSNTIEEEGADAAIKEYKALRQSYYASHAYDFSERTLARFGNGLMNSEHPEDGIAIHRLNTDLHPESPVAWQGLASGYEAIGDTVRAISYYGQALILDPDNDRVVRSLKKLKQ